MYGVGCSPLFSAAAGSGPEGTKVLGPAVRGCGVLDRLLLLGATGDLAGRFLLPALARLQADGRVPPDLQVVGAAPQVQDDAAFRAGLAARGVDASLLPALRYRPVDLADPATVREALGAFDGAGPVVVYLALPPDLFAPALDALAAAGLPPGSRVAVEKPFGTDRESAAALNAQLAGVDAYRVDHVLGKPAAQDLPRLSAPGGPLADPARVVRVELLWEETLALEGRAGFYDSAGAVVDVVQNHLLQVLALLAMDLSPGGDVPAARLEVLRAARVVGPGRRGRYTAGRLADGRTVPDYAREPGVDPARQTETAAELVVDLALPRWAGVPVVLRTGKALAVDRKGVLAHLRDPDEQVYLDLDGEVDAYVEVLHELLAGGRARSVGGAEAEQAWRVVEPVLAGWARGAAPLEEYPAGSATFG